VTIITLYRLHDWLARNEGSVCEEGAASLAYSASVMTSNLNDFKGYVRDQEQTKEPAI
jgi:hypothetical protein